MEEEEVWVDEEAEFDDLQDDSTVIEGPMNEEEPVNKFRPEFLNAIRFSKHQHRRDGTVYTQPTHKVRKQRSRAKNVAAKKSRAKNR